MISGTNGGARLARALGLVFAIVMAADGAMAGRMRGPAPTLNSPQVTCSQATLSWKSIPGTKDYNVSSFRVERNSQNISGTILPNNQSTTYSFTQSGLKASTTYSYKVYASYWGFPESDSLDPSAPQSVTTPACSAGVASVVGSLTLRGWSVGVDPTGTVAVVATGTAGIDLIDLRNPANPAVVGSLNLPNQEKGAATDGAYAYVIEMLADGGASLAVVDIQTLSRPAFVTRISLPGKFAGVGVVVQNGLAYVSATDAGLQIIDVSTPSAPVIVSSVPNILPALQMDVQDGFACLINGPGMATVDVRNPRSPVKVMEGQAGVWGIDAVPGTLWMAYPSQLAAWNTADPAHVTMLSATPAAGGKSVAVVNQDAVLGTTTGVQVVDIADPVHPRVIQNLAMGREVLRVVPAGNLVLAIDTTLRMSVIRLTP